MRMRLVLTRVIVLSKKRGASNSGFIWIHDIHRFTVGMVRIQFTVDSVKEKISWLFVGYEAVSKFNKFWKKIFTKVLNIYATFISFRKNLKIELFFFFYYGWVHSSNQVARCIRTRTQKPIFWIIFKPRTLFFLKKTSTRSKTEVQKF